MLAYVVEEGGRLTGEQLPVPGAEEIMAGFIRRFGGRDATRVARTAIEVAACQQRDDLVLDQIVFDLLIPVVAAAAAGGGHILDGFPTTLPQDITAAELGVQLDLTLDTAVYLHVPEPVLVQRLLAWVRPDDTPEVIRHRLQVFTDTASPLISYYRLTEGSSSRWAPTSSLSPLPPRSKPA
jgi:adenylate kinase